MKKRLRNLLYFSSTEQRGILLLCLLILLILCAPPVYRHCSALLADRQELPQNDSLQMEYQAFKASLQAKAYPGRKREEHARPLTPFVFDPNTADSADLCRMGLSDRIVRNVMRYRRKGGRFRQPSDFRKIYGLTDEQYTALAPYIRIVSPSADAGQPSPDQPVPPLRHPAPVVLFRPDRTTDSLQRIPKYPAGTVIELNRADTTELKRIPGIGSGIARLITAYRQRLGGFHHIEQLKDINLDFEQLRPWFRIDTTAIRRLHLNRADIEQLRHHPYLNFYQAKAIVEWRKKHGRLHSLKPFLLYEEFTEDDFKRLQPYVCFD